MSVTPGRRTILAVDQEPAILTFLQRLLGGHAYTVLTARNADEALAVSARYPGPVHLLLTELGAPNCRSRHLAERLNRERPGIRTLYLTALASERALRHAPMWRCDGLISKPFSVGKLLAKVRELLPAEPLLSAG
jgi:DNA-binding response OmpR family regulator